MRRFCVVVLAGVLGVAALSGCSSTVTSLPNQSIVRDLAASYVAAHAFDSARLALERGDDARLRSAGADLKRAGGILSENNAMLLAFTATMVTKAYRIESQSTLAPTAQRSALIADANEKYRTALAFLPDNYSDLSWQMLNVLGYFLADRGKNTADFKLAVELTEKSLQKATTELDQLPEGSPQRAQAELSRATAPRDSYAWALFRVGRFKDAKREQEEVLRVLRSPAGASEPISAEIPYHMAEIYKALGQKAEARREYQNALQLRGDAELRSKIEAALKSLGK